ncbi:hypothetical protein SASPL_131902 [Salvia splendens]|uniref:FHA domain-containing protein n=1 Tax=Salvia splendens TaxID=180675 RepID=A0A8X8X895_SALSN|nr:FHA domain-containing protein At4g14490 [Salvia splendens]KAG6408876.1 hypothetical protein SASPL_131902 [Salvia splendens]
MPPRRSAAASIAGEGDQGPTLKLIIEKGPLSGNTREFRAGTAVKIGRLVRGNTLAIKDSGISSNHLLIQAEETPEPADRRWTVSDLDSSNGSILNDAQLEPFETAALSHGDVIKIGEKTSIRVEIVSRADTEVGSGVRRNTRRRVRGQVVDLGVIDEFSELGLHNNADVEKTEVEANHGRNVSTRRTRNSARNENLAKDLNVEENKDLGTSGIKETRGVSTRRTRSSKKEDNVEEIVVDLSLVDGKRSTRGGGRGKKKLVVETICEKAEKEEPNPEREEERERSEIGAGELKNTGIEENVTSSVEAGKGKMMADLEKMTLGEWLDFLAVYEPQQIIAETEEMLADMRQKAERCHEFMLQQKKAQG